MISNYFGDSDAVDNHNKSRQGDLALEEHWRTTDCWLNLAITFIGITATDTWNSARHHCTEESGFPGMSVNRFAECIVYDLWNKPWGKKRKTALVLGVPDTADDSFAVLPSFDGVEVVPRVSVSPSGSLDKIMREHVIMKTEQTEGGIRKKDRLRRACKIGAHGCKALQRDRKKTIWECGHPDCRSHEYKANKKTSRGIFICQNQLCLKTHCQEVWNKKHLLILF